jgi:ABC-type uncharacterized transport system involved in gliding motility auxiliary subunit
MPGLPSLLAALGFVALGFSLLSFFIMLFSGLPLRSDLAWIGGNLVIGLVLLVSAGVMNFEALRERMASGEARRVGKYGSSAIASTLLGIAILGMLGFLGVRYSHRFDLSEQKIHTLSDQSRKVLEGLESDVEVLALVPKLEQPPVRVLLDRYANESDRFQVEYADPNERPGLLQQHGIAPEQLAQGGLVRVAIGGNAVEIDELDESHLTNAIVKLSRQGEKVVYFVQGHGEPAIEGEAGQARTGFARAAEALRNENYRVESLLLARSAEVPADADVVIVAGAARPFFEPEIAALEGYLARGGALWVLVDPRVDTGLVERLGAWGVDLGDDIVIDRALALFGRAVSPLAGRYDAEHPITAALRDARTDPVMFHEVRSVRPGSVGSWSELVFTGEASWAERDLGMLDSEGAAAQDPDDLPGPVPVLIAGRPEIAPQDGGEPPRVVVAGDVDFASNEFLDAGRNRDLFLNATNWLIGDVEAISIRPNTSRASRFRLTQDQFSTIRSASLFVLPEAIALLGVFTWWSRRHPAGPGGSRKD